MKKKKLINKEKVYEGHGLKCDDCGERSFDVKHTTCPFDAEVHQRVTNCDLCTECRRQRARDV